MYELAKRLFPIPRSITGQGFRDSLEILNKTLMNGMLKKLISSHRKERRFVILKSTIYIF